MYAPDVVQGNDGRFYLYYCMSGEKGVGGYGQQISVAVCDTPTETMNIMAVFAIQTAAPC